VTSSLELEPLVDKGRSVVADERPDLVTRFPDTPNDDVPRPLGGVTRNVINEYAVAAVVAVNVVILLRLLLDWHGLFGAVMIFLITFLLVHYALVRQSTTKELASDRLTTTLIWCAGLVVITVLAWIFGYTAARGLKLLRLSFLKQDSHLTTPTTPGGGVYQAIVGSLEQVGLAAIFAVPISILTAVYLHELDGKIARPIRFIVEGLAGLPSIVAGLLIFSIWSHYAGAHAAMALGILMLPTVTRTSEEILRTVPDSLREAALALGAPQWRVVTKVVLPTARSGLLTAAILGVARAIGETAPVLLTAFDTKYLNKNPLKEPQSSLPTYVWNNIRVDNKLQNDRAWAAALLLLLIVLVLFALARYIGGRGAKKLGRS
jgi:phosphate transport system permease protein